MRKLIRTKPLSGLSGAERKAADRHLLERLVGSVDGSEFAEKHPIVIGYARSRLGRIAAPFLTRGLERAGHRAHLAYIDEEIVGSAAYQQHGLGTEGNIQIYRFVTLPEMRGHGIGHALMDAVAADTWRRGIPRMRIGGGSEASVRRIHERFLQRNEGRVHDEGDYWVRMLASPQQEDRYLREGTTRTVIPLRRYA